MTQTPDPIPVLVTGGAGYIGSHACEALAREGFLPVTYDNLSRGHRRLVKFGPFEEGDIRDRERLLEVMARWKPRAVMHFAAFTYVGESVEDPSIYYDNNTRGAQVLLDAMRASGVELFVFSSTAATYGQPPEQPMTERTPTVPINPYGRSKLMVEQILRDYDTAYGVRSVSLRYFNACGAHPTADIGELHEPEPHLIPRALMALQGKIEALDIMGTDYPTPDGTAVRDYIHVCDLADAHVAAIRYLMEGGETSAMNLGAGRGNSVKEVADAVERATGRKLPVRLAGRRAGDPPVLVADPSLARDKLGWRARWTDLEQVIASAWRWHQACAAEEADATGPVEAMAATAAP
ncbi:MAG TPA: UDP-glucose 4-epimerase GalE [Caulobacteraceae bacterium]|jgi:UDP-glucose-4-epimerase GalE